MEIVNKQWREKNLSRLRELQNMISILIPKRATRAHGEQKRGHGPDDTVKSA